MVYQATLDDHRSQRPAKIVARKVGDLTHDFATLAELQGELLAEDARHMARGMIAPAVLAGGAVVLLFAGVPLLLLAIAHALIQFAHMLPWAAYLVTGFGALITCGALLLAAKDRLRGISQSWQRSRDELVLNLRWLKQELAHGRSENTTTARSANGSGPM